MKWGREGIVEWSESEKKRWCVGDNIFHAFPTGPIGPVELVAKLSYFRLFTTSILTILSSELNLHDCKNQLMELFDYQSFDMITKFLKNRAVMSLCGAPSLHVAMLMNMSMSKLPCARRV